MATKEMDRNILQMVMSVYFCQGNLSTMKCDYLLVLVLVFYLISCAGPGKILKRKDIRSLDEMVVDSPVFSRSFTGFTLYDPATRQFLYEYNADKYFTPASNTKILTLYGCINILGDTLPLLRYYESNDTIHFWPTGDPTLFHPAMPTQDTVLRFFFRDGKNFVLHYDHFDDEIFGPAWSWADYQWSYQPERSVMPVYGNFVRAFGDSLTTKVHFEPAFFSRNLGIDTTLEGKSGRIRRDRQRNRLVYNGKIFDRHYERDIPYITSPELTGRLIRYITTADISSADEAMSRPGTLHTLPNMPVDTVYSYYMKESDNFIAEQLLLMCSEALFDTLSSERAINYILDSLLMDTTDQLLWYDGSGLSRYNLLTPRIIVDVLEKIYDRKGLSWVKHIFAAGGVSGTIRDWYAAEPHLSPYVYAKTGTLRNKHALSGYLISRSGNVFLFSFMHNNFNTSTNELKREMQKVLEWVRDRI